jgi:HlyD family secretion protein
MKKFPAKYWIIALGLLALSGWLLRPATEQAQIKYQTQPLSIGKIESTVNSAGSISPVVTVEVGSELSGLISELNVDFNDQVQSGQVIARIDDRSVRSRLKQSEADLAVDQASLLQLKAALSKAKSELALAERENQRKKELRQQKQISESEMDISETDFILARVNVDGAIAAVGAGEARVQQSQASLEQVRLDLERTFIRSPVDGVIIDRKVDKGQAVSASLSAPTLFSIAQDLGKMQIEAAVDEADIGRIKQAQEVRFTVDAFPERKFVGVVSQVRKSATITSNVVTYKVIISLDNSDLSLLPGMTANVDIVLGQRNDVLRVANSALRFSPESGGDDKQGGANNNERAVLLAQQLNLDADQQVKFLAVMADMQLGIQQMRQNAQAAGGPPPDMRAIMAKLHSKSLSELKSFLSPEQISQYQELLDQRRKSNAEASASGYQRGTVWLLRDGQPQRVNVRVGIADQEFSEIVSDSLQSGDQVIVRAQRVLE